MRKKILPVLLTLAMVLGMLPMSVFATGEEAAAGTITAAIQAAADGTATTINVATDTQEDVVIPANKNITLNITAKLTNASGDTITVETGGKLTITGSGTVDNITNAKAALVNNGEANLNGCTFSRSMEAGTFDTSTNTSSPNGNSYYTVVNSGTMVIDGATVLPAGTVEAPQGFHSSLIRNNLETATGTEKATLTIKSGKFSGGVNTVKNDNNAVLAIEGGNFRNTKRYAVQNWGTATISDGTFDCTGAVTGVIQNLKNESNSSSTGELTVTGGDFKAAEGQSPISGSSSYPGTFNVTGGMYNQPVTAKYLDESVKFQAVTSNGVYTYHATEALAKAAAGTNGVVNVKTEDGSAMLPAIKATGFIWNMEDTAAKAKVTAAGGTVGSDWIDQTMWIVFDRPLGNGTYYWFDVKIGDKTYGIAALGDDTHKTYAFSFLNLGQWDKGPAADDTNVFTADGELNIGGKSTEISVYKTASQLSDFPIDYDAIPKASEQTVTVPAKPANANPNLKIESMHSEVPLYAQVKISGMKSDKTYAIRLAKDQHLNNGEMTIIILQNPAAADYQLYCKDGQKIWVFEYTNKNAIQAGESQHISLATGTAVKQ